MDFTPVAGTIWLAYRKIGNEIDVAGRIVGWDTSGDDPVPVCMFVDEGGALHSISTPPPGQLWVAETWAAAVAAAEEGTVAGWRPRQASDDPVTNWPNSPDTTDLIAEVDADRLDDEPQ